MKLLLLYFSYAFVANFKVIRGFDVVALQTGFDNHGVIAAFGDYNADKLVDVFVISPSGMRYDIICKYLQNSPGVLNFLALGSGTRNEQS